MEDASRFVIVVVKLDVVMSVMGPALINATELVQAIVQTLVYGDVVGQSSRSVVKNA